MTLETEISTPVETSDVDTSADVETTTETQEEIQVEDTSTAETTEEEVTAETETQQPEEKLYAGKYKSVEELEKGYGEVQKFVNKAHEFEKKYNELLQAQQEQAQRAHLERLQHAQQRGFDSVEAQEIADKVQVAELEYYAQNLNQVDPEHYETVRQLLGAYVQTAHKSYLDEAKRYFSSDFVEKVVDLKRDLRNRLQGEHNARIEQQRNEAEMQLAEVLKADYSEFLADVATNEGKAQALKSFCDVGSIRSKEDMQVFADIYGKIAKYEREQALKELEAQKTIEETKQKAVIGSSAVAEDKNTGLKASYTAAEIGAMSQAEYNALCDKYGEMEISKRII